MAFPQKTIYALRAMYELAKRQGDGAVSIPIIAKAQGIPPRFLENILIQLKQAGLTQSIRGKEGGYLLRKPADAVTVGDVLRAVDGPMDPVSCLGGETQETCPMHDDCVFLPMWQRAHEAMLAVYDGTSFADLLRDGKNH
ncbi:MAG TPA: Rrf2 family transcriptional regulator [Candidatus Hydrogenedentes bacterium]|nr:Rrf2 family transcriptional regulator [Candidatus Hydrogenedentota bacterium]HPG68380.1 Rrf2 family transcriptional regulator [Candidatus Hydrogenedentota bacterium]